MIAAGKDKKKILLPADVLEARTVLVVIDPDAGISPTAPYANRAAQEDVEKALMKWGRFELATDLSTADLVITVRKGNGNLAQPTIGGIPNNNRPIIFEPTESGGRAGGSRGTPPMGETLRRLEEAIRRRRLKWERETTHLWCIAGSETMRWMPRQCGGTA
jgi:hypothetical protein